MWKLIDHLLLVAVAVMVYKHPLALVVLATVFGGWITLLWVLSGCAEQDIPTLKRKWREFVRKVDELGK